ncbi:hypothetical protein OG427_07005 [Streptomyces sp. NBC_00133]|uniref:hypothetical protein n=1 Tax=Streptomyces sp. NBC_00133 TaxID=2903624 RepID=UPI0032486A59
MTASGYCEQQLAVPNPGATNECALCRRHWQEAEVVRQTYTAPKVRERARWWPQRRELEVFDVRASDLNSADVYTLSGCDEIHHVVAVADRGRESHTELLVYLLADDEVLDLRVRRDRLLRIQRPSDLGSGSSL